MVFLAGFLNHELYHPYLSMILKQQESNSIRRTPGNKHITLFKAHLKIFRSPFGEIWTRSLWYRTLGGLDAIGGVLEPARFRCFDLYHVLFYSMYNNPYTYICIIYICIYIYTYYICIYIYNHIPYICYIHIYSLYITNHIPYIYTAPATPPAVSSGSNPGVITREEAGEAYRWWVGGRKLGKLVPSYWGFFFLHPQPTSFFPTIFFVVTTSSSKPTTIQTHSWCFIPKQKSPYTPKV